MPSTAAEKSRSGLSGCLFATSTNLYELPVEVVPQRVLDKSGRASKVVDGEVLKSGSEGINGLCKVGRSGGCSGEVVAEITASAVEREPRASRHRQRITIRGRLQMGIHDDRSMDSRVGGADARLGVLDLLVAK
jgi:hypothetical protein